MPGSNEPKRGEGVGGQLIIPVAGILFTAYYASTIWDSPLEAQIAAMFVGTILVLLSAIFILRHLLHWRAREISLAPDDVVGRKVMLPKRLALFALTVGFMWFIEDLGFTIATFLFLAGAILVLSGGRRPLLAISAAAVAAIVGYLLFIVAFDTRFPKGPFETFAKGLFA